MKTLLGFASVLAFAVAPACAGEGHVSSQSLAKMGLSGMKTMSESQGMKIRGLSIAIAGGGSVASINGVGGTAIGNNFYFSANDHKASGYNLTYATDTQTVTSVSHGQITVISTTNTIAAGGFSSASAGGR
jgi:hypothetical protein